MANCRSIGADTWEHARDALIYYFSRRGLSAYAEDLAHETIKSLLSRPDYEFELESDFLRVCFAFARRVLQEGRRKSEKHSGAAVVEYVAAPSPQAGSLRGAEVAVYLDEIQRIGAGGLNVREWKLILEAASADYGDFSANRPADERNRMRVGLHRARRALAKLVGGGKGGNL